MRTLLLDRPRRRNALDGELRAALAAALDRAESDGRRVVVIGAAPGEAPLFAAGADLRTIGRLGPLEAWSFAAEGQALWRRLEDAPALVVAAVDGPCMGGALDLAAACDLVLASERARFAHPGARLGIVTGWGGTRRLPRAAGEPAARRLFATAAALDATEAREAGLAVDVVPDAAFLAAVQARAATWAATLARRPPAEIAAVKRALRAGRGAGRAGRGTVRTA